MLSCPLQNKIVVLLSNHISFSFHFFHQLYYQMAGILWTLRNLMNVSGLYHISIVQRQFD